MRKRDKKLDSHAAEKGVKKLVSSDCAKILEKESSNQDERNLWKTMFTPSNPTKATNPIVTA
jgi:hypothetical protein